MSSRFYIPPEHLRPPLFTLTGTEARHASLVLRKQVGDVIELFDGKDLSFKGKIEFISDDRVTGVLIETNSPESAMVPLTLAQGLIKGNRWDWLVEKACEVGATRLVPLITARTIVKPTHSAGLDRWRRIALAAAKQSGRSRVMEIAAPLLFTEFVQSIVPNDQAFIPWEKETTRRLKGKIDVTRPVTLFIGPEGGWEGSEVELAERRGAVPISIGSQLLRSETAGLVALAQVLAERGA